MNKQNLQISLWLNQFEWTFFCTFTTEFKLTLNSARRAMQRLFEKIRSRISNVRLFWVAERFESKCGYHIHALIYVNPEGKEVSLNCFKCVQNSWKAVSGGRKKNFAEISRFNGKLGASFYITKELEPDTWGIL